MESRRDTVNHTNPIAALDPGRDKCGFAVLASTGDILLQRVLETAKLEQELKKAQQELGFSRLILGNGTTSKEAKARIEKALPALEIQVVDEYKTTEQARGEYWLSNPPKGLMRLIPTTMRTPPCPVDDYVAVILARRHLQKI